jgi:nucleoid-associated protein YgaU
MIKKAKRFAATMIAIVVSLLLFMTVPAFAQSLADAARQERERKKATVRRTHVYTNEDLAKQQILLPEDLARVTAPEGGAADPTVASVPAASPAARVAPWEPIEARKRARPVAASVQGIMPGSVAAEPASGKAALSATKSKPVSSPTSRRSDIPLPVINLPQQFEVASPLPSAMPVESGPDSNAGFSGVSEPAKPAISGTASASQAEINGLVAPLIIGTAVISGIAAERPTIPYPVVSAGTQPPVTRETVRSWIAEPPVLPAASDRELRLAAPVIERPAEVARRANADVIPANNPPLPAQPPARVATTAAEARTVLVRVGDSLWKLAAHYLGYGQRWREIAKLNPQVENPSFLRPGEPIRVPVLPSQDGKKILVRRGDTLWSLARTELGQPLAFSCIAHANQLPSVDLIEVGETLIVPGACGVSR